MAASEAATQIATDWYGVQWFSGDKEELATAIDAAIRDAVKAEQEACAAVCLSLDHGEPLRGEEVAFVHGSVLMRAKCARAIRARNPQQETHG